MQASLACALHMSSSSATRPSRLWSSRCRALALREQAKPQAFLFGSIFVERGRACSSRILQTVKMQVKLVGDLGPVLLHFSVSTGCELFKWLCRSGLPLAGAPRPKSRHVLAPRGLEQAALGALA